MERQSTALRTEGSHLTTLPLHRPTIIKILEQLPDKGTRQALLFSATFPQDVQVRASTGILAFVLHPNPYKP